MVVSSSGFVGRRCFVFLDLWAERRGTATATNKAFRGFVDGFDSRLCFWLMPAIGRDLQRKFVLNPSVDWLAVRDDYMFEWKLEKFA